DEGAIRHRAWKVGGRYWNIIAATGRVQLDTAVSALPAEQLDFLLHSESLEVSNRSPGFVQRFTYEGIVPRLRKRIGDTRGLDTRGCALSFFRDDAGPAGGGRRLSERARGVRIGDVRFADVCRFELEPLADFVAALDDPVAEPIRRRLLPLVRRMLQ